MPTTVGQYQLTTFTTPAASSSLASSVVRGNLNTVRTNFNGHDADPGIHLQSGLAASRPAAGSAGRTWIASDTLRMTYDTGATWSELAYLPTAGGAVNGAVTVQIAFPATFTNAVGDFATSWQHTGSVNVLGVAGQTGGAAWAGLVSNNSRALRLVVGGSINAFVGHTSGGVSLLDATDPGAGVVRAAGALTVTGNVTVSGSLSANGGGTLSGTFAGSPTFSGNPTFIGTITGNTAFSGSASFASISSCANIGSIGSSCGLYGYVYQNTNYGTMQSVVGGSLTSYNGANTATLTNAPTAGNPTKWVAISDNGVTRYIPTW